MKYVSPQMMAYLASDSASLATCWKIKRRDNAIFGFTDWTDNVTFNDGNGALTYLAQTGYTASALVQRSDLSVPTMSVQGMVSSDAINEDDLRGGKYDFAELWISMLNPNDLTAGFIKLRHGFLGQVELREGQHTTEIRGLLQLLTTTFVELYTSDCQADYGDSRCKKDLTAETDTGMVTSISTQRRVFHANMSTARAAGFYNFGEFTWTSGDNAGVTGETKLWDGNNFTLYVPCGFDIKVGDLFIAKRGCAKRLSDCKDRDNVINFRGYPKIPGLDKMLIYGSHV